MEHKKIVITGMGAVTSVGIGVEAYWNALVSGACGIRPVEKPHLADLPIKVAGEVRDFEAKDYMPPRLARDMEDFMQYAYVSAEEALSASGLEIESHRTGIVMSTALGGLAAIEAVQRNKSERGKKVGPKFMTRILGNIAAAQLSIAHDIRGPSLTVSTACASGNDAIGTAVLLLQSGAADAMIVMGGESGGSALLMESLGRAMALTHNPDPETACRPFDAQRNGFVVGEGGGALVLETEEHAMARNATILAEVAGCASNSDAFHTVAPRDDGDGARRCMLAALECAGMAPEDIDYINTHGTSTEKGDAIEVAAIKAALGEHARSIGVSSTKGATGHLMGAGGITEAVACVQAIRTGLLPPTLHYKNPDPECDLDVIPNQARQQAIRTAMSNAFGFGGQNACVIFRAYEK
jgi:3-oxoacyl-[acyl-carrier-protein] synthase II